MPRDAEQSTNERLFVLEALRQNLRLDGRRTDDYRSVELNFGQEYGAVEACFGKTRVLVRISCEVTMPLPERKFDGIFTISVELSTMASPSFEQGRPTTDEILLSRLLEKSIRRSGALDTEALCIVAGQKCFSLRADVHVLDHDGDLIDATCFALVAALRHFRRPDVAVEGEKVTVFDAREREPVTLSMLHHPLCCTVSYFDAGEIAVVDATKAEENVREGQLIFTMNRHGEVCQTAKYGGNAVPATAVFTWANMALNKIQVLSKLMETKLQADARSRDIGGLLAELSAENERGGMEPPPG